MADFGQVGVVPTLHDLGHRSVTDLEHDLRSWSQDRPVALIIPCLASEVESDAFAGVVDELSRADWISQILVGLDDADAADRARTEKILQGLPQRCDVLWNDSAPMAALEARLAAQGLAPRSRGKGRNVWYCIGAVLAQGGASVIAMHDADIAGYSRELPARLVYPVAHPGFGYSFAKGYYHRVTEGRFGGRVTRLLVAPLVRAIRSEAGDHPYLSFLEAFRYPLAGETAMDADLAAGLRIPGHWGMDIGILSEVYEQRDPDGICQVSVANAYDHKHQDLSAHDPSAGLRRMSIDVAATILRRLGPDHAAVPAGLSDAYLQAAHGLIRHYANDAEINGYRVDVDDERATAEVFARSVADAVRRCEGAVGEDPVNPSWNEVFARDSEIKPMLIEALNPSTHAH